MSDSSACSADSASGGPQPPADASARFFEAAKKGNAAEVIALLEDAGLDINDENDDGMTALMLAAEGGHTAVARALLERNASYWAKECDGISPFRLAILNFDKSEGVCRLIAPDATFEVSMQFVYLPEVVATGNEKAVRYLIEELGVDVNERAFGCECSTALHSAVEANNASLCKYLLAKGADPRGSDAQQRSPLFRVKSKEVLALLLEAGLDMQESDVLGFTPLLALASEGADPLVLQALKDAGADATAVNRRGQNGLHLCCNKGSEAVAAWFLDNGLDINAEDSWGVTPLHHCAMAGNAKVCRFLVGRGANPNVQGPLGRAPVFFASNGEVLTALIEGGANLEALDRMGKTPLLASVGEDSTNDMLDCFAAAGANINAQDHRGRNCFLLACQTGCVGAVEWCLSKGLSLNSVDIRGQTGLHYAARATKDREVRHVKNEYVDRPAASEDHAGVIRLLVERGLPIDILDNDGNTPLAATTDEFLSHYRGVPLLLLELGADIALLADNGCKLLIESCANGKAAFITRLLESPHCNINAQDEGGKTALHASAERGRLKITKLLLSKGANPNIRDRMGHTPFAAAAKGGHDVVALYFLEQNMDLTVADGQDGPLHAASSAGRAIVIRALLDRGCSVHARGRHGQTPLHAIATSSRADFSEAAAQTLIDAGADIEALDNEGSTPLFAAASSFRAADNAAAVTFLLAKGANADAKNGRGRTALCEAAFQCSLEICSALIDHGADVNAQGVHGAPIHAAISGHAFMGPVAEQQALKSAPRIVLLLIERGARLDLEVAPVVFPYPSLDTGLVRVLAPVLKPQLCSRTEALTLHRKVLDWALASPAVAAVLPGWMTKLRPDEGADFQRSLDWDSSMQLRKQKVSAIGDAAWDRRKELVAAFALARKARHGGGGGDKRPKLSSSSAEDEGGASGEK